MKYVYFDLDETLIDNKKAQNTACECLYKNYDFSDKVSLEEFVKTWDDLSEYYYSLYLKKEISYDMQRIKRIEDLFNKYDVSMDKKANEIFSLYLKFYEDNWCLFDDVEDTLKKLNDLGYKIGIISNGDLNQQKSKIIKTGISKYIFDITTSSEYNFSKPDIRIFSSACEKNNIGYDEICYIGDDYNKDIVPCLKLGIKAIWLNRNNKEIENISVIQISTLSELFDFFITEKNKLEKIRKI